MLSEGFISGSCGLQGAEDQEERCRHLLHQLSGDGQRATVSGPYGQCYG